MLPIQIKTRCLIAGGGPAGMMLGLLLARTGVNVIVLEKHADFLRDFRGDTVHPSTLQVMRELGLLDSFLQRPHDKAHDVRVTAGKSSAVIGDFRRLSGKHIPFIAMMPQWEFLDFLREEAARYPNFRLIREAQVLNIMMQAPNLVIGMSAMTPQGRIEVYAGLTVGADGRNSRVREAASLPVHDLGAPIDVLWMRVARKPGDPAGSGGRIGRGSFLATIDRGDYWQCAYVIRKGGYDEVKARGLPAFREDLVRLMPVFADRIETDIESWWNVKLLSVSVDRLEKWWKPGLLCIGDAAHAMSPIGGVGINLAIQDAVAAANLLAGPLADPKVTPEELTPLLEKVQERRMFPTQVTQAVQVFAQNRLIGPLLNRKRPPRMPLMLRLFQWIPVLRKIPAYAIGIGVRPEHVTSPDQNNPAPPVDMPDASQAKSRAKAAG